jgi:hypothetical protein
MNRRQFVKACSIGTATVAIAGGGIWLAIEKHKGDLSIDASLRLLDALNSEQITTLGQWNLAQIFTHCAQSVEFSMFGFPEHKSQIFKSTVGSLAFSAFNAKGKMTHNLSEAIPGAQVLDPSANIEQAKQRFKLSMQQFKSHQGELAEHFAYGKLSKADYERAHAMHFNNHLSEFVQNA